MNHSKNLNKEIYGVKANLLIDFNGALPELSSLISKNLNIPQFVIDTDQDSPHRPFGTIECLGFEIWLHQTTEYEGYNFILSMETQNCLDELTNNRMHDISIWFSNYVQLVCDKSISVKHLH
jgi:hypothetical protein